MPDENEYEETGGARSFWTGTIAFGLVSLPVSLYTANRSSRVSLRMLDEDGTPLARRYFCTKEDIPLTRDDLVRGYEVEPDKFIEIADEELEALVPKKSKEIDLRRFVPLETVDPMYFERAYFLIPEEGAIKAYRLLAQSMQSMGRAGIATVVMRGKEYLIAIIAEGGILRAETLRFYDELRTPADVGLPPLDKAPAAQLDAITREINKLAADELDRSELTDEPSKRLLQLVERKLESGEGVLEAAEEPDAEPESAEIIDLMEILKQSLQTKVEAKPDAEPQPAKQPAKQSARKKAKSSAKGSATDGAAAKAPARKKAAALNESAQTKTQAMPGRSKSPKKATRSSAKPKAKVDPDMSKTELYEKAKTLDIPGRSHMSKEELVQAIRHNS